MRLFRITRIKLVTLCGLTLMTGLYVIIMTEIGTNRLRDGQFLQLTSCPACYGRKMCNDFHSGAIKFAGFSRLPSLHFLNVKNVHRATLRGQRIVLKKLAHDKELEEADAQICKLTTQTDNCHSGESLFRHKFDAGEVLHPASLRGLSDLVACPSPRLLARMEDKFEEKEEYLLHSEKLMIYTTLMINPEPLVLQMFPSKEGWPFPEFMGACGRWVAVEEIPRMLIDFINDDFDKRAGLAKQILQIADKFTKNSLNYALYWTDVDYDNYGVKDDGKVVIIDAENILVVDQERVREQKPNDYDQPVYSRYDQCKPDKTCLSFQPDLLCQRTEADLNYYAVCRGILAPDAARTSRPNLLHGIPGWVNDKWDLDDLLKQCSRPETPNGRFLVKDKLLLALEKISNGAPL